jgi:hypothetical protein
MIKAPGNTMLGPSTTNPEMVCSIPDKNLKKDDIAYRQFLKNKSNNFDRFKIGDFVCLPFTSINFDGFKIGDFLCRPFWVFKNVCMKRLQWGAMTFGITTLSIMTLIIKTLSIIGLLMALSINGTQHKWA